MRYRALDASDDMTFGHGRQDFLTNTPDAVAQAVMTRLRLLSGEWFLNLEEGTPYSTQILGKGTGSTYDQAIRDRILGTQGVTEIVSYSSLLKADRKLEVESTVDTIYGQITVTVTL